MQRRRWLFSLIILGGIVLGLLTPAGIHAQSTTINQTDYQAILNRLHTLLDNADSSNFATTKEELDTLAQQLREIEQVTLDNGQTIPVDHRDLADALEEATTEDVSTLIEQIEAIQMGEVAQSQPPDEAILQDVLSRPEYEWEEDDRQNYLADLWTRLLRWLLNLIPEEAIGTPIFRYLIPGVGAIVLIAVFIYFLLNLYRSFSTETEANDAEDEGDEFLSADNALKRAQDLSHGGDYRTAVRYLYLSALLLLDERNLLRYDRSRTNREYLRSVAHRPELATILQDVVDIFDQVWYGYRPIEQNDYQHYESQVTKLKQLR